MSDTEEIERAEGSVTRVSDMFKYFKSLKLENLNPAIRQLQAKIESQNSEITELKNRVIAVESESKAHIQSTNLPVDKQKIEPTTRAVLSLSEPSQVDKSKSKVLQSMLAELPICDGKVANQLIKFIIAVDKLIQLELVPQSEYVSWIMTRTTGFLADWWFRRAATLANWQSIKPLILNEFLSPIHIETLKNEMCLRYQYESETLLEFAHSIDAVAKALNLGWTEEALMQTILSRISPKTYYYIKCNPMDIINMSQLARISSEVEGALLRDRLHSQNSRTFYQKNESQDRSYGGNTYRQYNNPARESYRSPSRGNRASRGSEREVRASGVLPPPVANTVNMQRGPRCYECNDYGHFGRDCEQRRRRLQSHHNNAGNANRE